MELRRQSQTILVVDDYCALHRLVKVFLEREGYTVLTADGAESALNLYKDHKSAIALLLTDVDMPNVSGLELADRVLQLEPKMKILFMSALGDASRGFGCVRKPFTHAHLISRVGEALSGAGNIFCQREQGHADTGSLDPARQPCQLSLTMAVG